VVKVAGDETQQALTRALTRMTDGYNGADAVLAADLIDKLIEEKVTLAIDAALQAHVDKRPHIRSSASRTSQALS
jgi:hypothetical protein